MPQNKFGVNHGESSFVGKFFIEEWWSSFVYCSGWILNIFPTSVTVLSPWKCEKKSEVRWKSKKRGSNIVVIAGYDLFPWKCEKKRENLFGIIAWSAITSSLILNDNIICFIAFLDVFTTKNIYQKNTKNLGPPPPYLGLSPKFYLFWGGSLYSNESVRKGEWRETK